jgi:hypothetical protein
LSAKAHNRIRRVSRSGCGIFLNIPYSEWYSAFETAIIATVTAYGLTPHMARQRAGLEVRAQKIFELILGCKYGLTDLSYLKRMNMPLELGLMLALGKENFVVTRMRYRSLRSISDLNFGDIHEHNGKISKLVQQLSNWIEQTCSGRKLATATLLRRYRMVSRIRRQLGGDFDKRLPEIASALLFVLEDEFHLPQNLASARSNRTSRGASPVDSTHHSSLDATPVRRKRKVR